MAGTDFELNAPIDTGVRYTRAELESVLDSYKDYFRRGIEDSTKGARGSRNDERRLRGLRQGPNQCFVTCYLAWFVLQGDIDVNAVRSLIGRMHEQLTDNSMLGVVAAGRVGGQTFHELLVHIAGRMELATPFQVQVENAKTEWNSVAVFNSGKKIGKEMSRGAGMIIQDGNHFKLVFIDRSGRTFLFDPLRGEPTQGDFREAMDQWTPLDIQANMPSLVLLSPTEGEADFVIH